MRTATILDYWRKTYKRKYQIKVSDMEYVNLRGFGNGKIEFNGGITAICGANGVGKTTLLNALVELTKTDETISSNISALKLGAATLSATLNILQGKEDEIQKTLMYECGQVSESDEIDYEMVWLDLSAQGPLMVSRFSEMTNLEELLNSVEPIIFDENELTELSFIVGKEYDNCYMYELELVDEEVPYFVVETGGVKYGTELMGLGELSILYILWNMKRISEKSIMVIDEPETYLAHRSQIGILDVMARYSSEKSIWMIISTHSFGMLSRIPPDHIKLLTRVGSDVRITTHNDDFIYLNALGMPKQKTGVIFVEDRVAREFTRLWIGRFAPHLVQQYLIKDVGSASEIVSTLKFPILEGWISIIGVFDGDQRNKITDKNKTGYNWPCSFLPSNKPPEKILKDAARGNITALATMLQKNIDETHIILGNLEGKDHHDWIIELHKELGIGFDALMKALFEIYVINNELEAKEAFDELLEAMKK
ncbi:AAA family ATPase [Priestia megaterium]|uniref:ATP-dependent nuclease n=1 Tax=Priestia megaterium TaxID=1404 RepID=UPI002E1F3CE5|nr:AAA family ATPase [Priestia megaterium]MED3934403.1 AAA family ATPase [Priestia megaterium]